MNPSTFTSEPMLLTTKLHWYLCRWKKDPYDTGYCSQKMIILCVCAQTGNNDYYKFI